MWPAFFLEWLYADEVDISVQWFNLKSWVAYILLRFGFVAFTLTHAHARTRTHTHAHTHAHTQTNTHCTCFVVLSYSQVLNMFDYCSDQTHIMCFTVSCLLFVEELNWTEHTQVKFSNSTGCSRVPQLNTATVHWRMHSVKWQVRVCDRFYLFFITPTHGHPHAVFRGFISISGGWMLLCKELIVAEESPHICSA